MKDLAEKFFEIITRYKLEPNQLLHEAFVGHEERTVGFIRKRKIQTPVTQHHELHAWRIAGLDPYGQSSFAALDRLRIRYNRYLSGCFVMVDNRFCLYNSPHDRHNWQQLFGIDRPQLQIMLTAFSNYWDGTPPAIIKQVIEPVNPRVVGAITEES